MPAKSDPRGQGADSEYYYRRAVNAGGLLRALGFGATVGLAAFYVARLYLERTPLAAGRVRIAGSRLESPGIRTRHG
ncbi:MAG TPA: hypothetical protein VII52_10630 [Gemmatimonadaceae bacterium]